MTILITGGAGFIGSHLADAYIAQGDTVHVIDNLATGSRKNVHGQVIFHDVDIRDLQQVNTVFAMARPELVIHAAAQASIPHSLVDPEYDFQVNVTGTEHLVKAAQATGSVKRFVNISTAGVLYGDQAARPTPETAVPVISNPYVEHKMAAEAIVNAVTEFSVVTARLSNVYGPRQNPKTEAGVIGIFIEALRDGRAPMINGDGLQTRDFVFVSDVVRALQLLGTSTESGVFHVSSSIETTVADLYQVIASVMQSSVVPGHGPVKPHEQRYSCIDATRLRTVLAWQPEVVLHDGITQTVAAVVSEK